MKNSFLYTAMCLAFCFSLSVAEEKPSTENKSKAIQKEETADQKYLRRIGASYITPILSPELLKTLQPKVYEMKNRNKAPKNNNNSGC